MGDSRYVVELLLITPFRNPKAGSAESNYNHAHAPVGSNVEK